MSQVKVVTLSRLMGDLISGSSASSEFAAMYPEDEELMKQSLLASQGIIKLLITLREKLIEEGYGSDQSETA